MITPFHPSSGSTVSITVGAASANVQVTTGTGLTQVRIMNNGSATVWIRFGTDNTVTAATSDLPIASGATEVFSRQGPIWVAAIAAAASGVIYFTPGEGI